MVANGLRLDHFHGAAPVCSPTRASVLTGRTNDRAGVKEQGYALRLQERTLAQALRQAGYVHRAFRQMASRRAPRTWRAGPCDGSASSRSLRLRRMALAGQVFRPRSTAQPTGAVRGICRRFDELVALDRSVASCVGGMRGFKGTPYEGGLCVPAIIEWPQGIAPGRQTAFPASYRTTIQAAQRPASVIHTSGEKPGEQSPR